MFRAAGDVLTSAGGYKTKVTRLALAQQRWHGFSAAQSGTTSSSGVMSKKLSSISSTPTALTFSDNPAGWGGFQAISPPR